MKTLKKVCNNIGKSWTEFGQRRVSNFICRKRTGAIGVEWLGVVVVVIIFLLIIKNQVIAFFKDIIFPEIEKLLKLLFS